MSKEENTVAQQEAEYAAWGLSKLAIRNIVVFLIVILCSTVVYLQGQNNQKDKLIIACQESNTTKVEQLMREMLALSQTQAAIEAHQATIQQKLKVVEKNMKKKKAAK